MPNISILEILTLPMVTREGLQRVDMTCRCSRPAHLLLDVFRENTPVIENHPVAPGSGILTLPLLLPRQKESFTAQWRLKDSHGTILAQTEAPWTAPRERTFYVMLSSHMDIGLHEAPYLQRDAACSILDRAKELVDETACRELHDRYRYTMEGTWFWNNFPQDRGQDAARELVRDYIRKGDIGLCCGVAGNHFQTFGLEELCRSAYERKRMQESWGLKIKTMSAIDINGIPMSLIRPYAEAGVENIIFAPNHWNPLPSTVWQMDMTKEGCYLNPDAGGGGSRADVRYTSDIPMVFFWEEPGGSRILVWASTQYGYGGASFGLFPNRKFVPETVPAMEAAMAKHLPLMEEKYPYDVWLLCCYDDNSEPNLEVTNSIAAWNAKWEWPRFRTLGDPDEPFRILRQKHAGEIPVLRGDITGGWYQHPVSVPELLAEKSEAHRRLPTAEKWSAAAALLDETYPYPAEDFRRAWDCLLFNDEHSYGTSGYQGRRVYETWMQHRDWIDKANETANRECTAALNAIAAKIHTPEDCYALFNPTAQPRQERILTEEGTWGLADVPAFGYALVDKSRLQPCSPVTEVTTAPPVIENAHYRIAFAPGGGIRSILDKALNRELLDPDAPFPGNQPVYTRDNHKTFHVPGNACFTVTRGDGQISVQAKTEVPFLGAEILQTVTLPDHEKRIEIDNRLNHVTDMVNTNRYHRYLYYAFPFRVENCRRYCHLNGTMAEYAVDVTGHGSDVYMAVNEWCCAQNPDFGVALMLPDNQLVEFDHIHPDKTDFGAAGEGSQMYVYAANDWLQMHTSGGSHLNYRFRYCITSYRGSYETAGIPRMAERYTNPVQILPLPKQTGTLKGSRHSFLQVPTGQRLTALKRADDGDGLIARLYGDDAAVIETDFGTPLDIQRVLIDERSPAQSPAPGKGFHTYRLGSGTLSLAQREVPAPQTSPAPIGSVYTGLITQPCAAPGEEDGQLYLLWGAGMEEDLSHYNLYRSEEAGFTPDETTFLTRVLPEPYRVGRWVDRGLSTHKCYFYRVCAVNTAGIPGPMSREFSAFTREPR